jgi:hypothetical protein
MTASETGDWPNSDIRPVCYVPTGQVLDLGRPLPETDYQLLASLHGQIGRGDNILRCESTGGDPWLTVYRHENGTFFARHFPGGGHHGDHAITRKSDEHRRAQDYIERGYGVAGITAGQEVTTNNRTRLDVATLDAPRISGFEVQLQDRPIPDIKARTTRSLHATALTGRYARSLPDGILPVWFSPDAGLRRQWLYHVPTIEAPTMSWDFLPKQNTVTAIGVRRIEAEKCAPGSRWQVCPLTGRGWCRSTHPFAVLCPGFTVDAVAAMVAAGQLVPLRYFTGFVYLVDPESAALYQELGGNGEYAAGTPRPGEHRLGPCKNYGHDIQVPAVGGQTWTERAWVLGSKAKQAHGWRCVRCGMVTPADPCPRCGSWRVLPSRERVRTGLCPLCGSEHQRCQFAAGSSFCIRPECGNPHHRATPSTHRGDGNS